MLFVFMTSSYFVVADDDEDDDDEEEHSSASDSGNSSNNGSTKTEITTNINTKTIVQKDSDGDGLLDEKDPHPTIPEIYIVADDDVNGIVDQFEK